VQYKEVPISYLAQLDGTYSENEALAEERFGGSNPNKDTKNFPHKNYS